MRVITACDVIPGAGRQGLRLLARPAPAALGVPPRTARTRPARRARRHPEGADPQRVAPGCPLMPPGEWLLVDCRRAHGLGEYSPPIHWHWPPGIDIRMLIDLEPGGHRFQVRGDCPV